MCSRHVTSKTLICKLFVTMAAFLHTRPCLYITWVHLLSVSSNWFWQLLHSMSRLRACAESLDLLLSFLLLYLLSLLIDSLWLSCPRWRYWSWKKIHWWYRLLVLRFIFIVLSTNNSFSSFHYLLLDSSLDDLWLYFLVRNLSLFSACLLLWRCRIVEIWNRNLRFYFIKWSTRSIMHMI